MTEQNKNDRTTEHNNDAPSLKPDPETLHKTDPQKNMEGPVSSLMHETGEAFNENKSEEEANEERDKKL